MTSTKLSQVVWQDLNFAWECSIPAESICFMKWLIRILSLFLELGEFNLNSYVVCLGLLGMIKVSEEALGSLN